MDFVLGLGFWEGLKGRFEVEVALGIVLQGTIPACISLARGREASGGTVGARCIVKLLGGSGSIAPFEAVVFIEIVGRIQLHVHLHEARPGFDAHIVGLGAELIVVGSISRAIGVLQQQYLLLQRGSEKDIILGNDWVVFHFGCCVGGVSVMRTGEWQVKSLLHSADEREISCDLRAMFLNKCSEFTMGEMLLLW